MKKFITVLLAAVMSLSVMCLGACNLGGNPPEPDADPNEININLDRNMSGVLEIMVPGGNSNEETMIQCLIDKVDENDEGVTFKDLFPNVDVEISYVSVSNYVSSVTNQQLAETLPDIVWSNSPDFYDLVEANTFINLTPYIKANELQSKVNTYVDEEGNAGKFSFEGDFYTEFFKMSSIEDKCYVIPRSCDTVVTYLNTDVLKAAGVDLDPATTKIKNGWTWDDFMSVCQQVRDYMDRTPGLKNDYVIDSNLTADWISVSYPMLASFGCEVIDKNGNVTIDSEATVKCMELVKEMVDKRYINDSTQAQTNSFENGHSAMIFQSASISVYAEKKDLRNGNLDLVTFPLITANNTPKIGAGVAGYAISSQSKNKELAWAFLSFLLSKQGQQRMALNGLNLASIRKDLSDPMTANWGKKYSTLNLDAFTWGAEYKIAGEFFLNTKLTAKAGIEDAIKQLFVNGTNGKKNVNIPDIISTALDKINQAMQDY